MPNLSRRQFAATITIARLLTACGGGSSDDGNKELTHRQLYAAYDIVVEGMGLAQLVSVLGAEPNRSAPGQEDGARRYTWLGDRGGLLRQPANVLRGLAGRSLSH